MEASAAPEVKPGFVRLATYNRWANRRLYGACAALGSADYHATRPAFFGSIHRTLNHVLVADRLWLARLEGRQPPALALDSELCATLPELTTAREAQDETLIDHVAGLDEAALAADVTYRNVVGEPFLTPRRVILEHVFNHHTHHRGQVHGMLSATEVPPPPLDLMYFFRETRG